MCVRVCWPPMYGFGGRLSSLRRSCKDFSRLARKLAPGLSALRAISECIRPQARPRALYATRIRSQSPDPFCLFFTAHTERVTTLPQAQRAALTWETSALSSKPISPAHLPGAAGSVPSSELCRSHASPASAPGSRSAAMEQSDPRKPARHVRAPIRDHQHFQPKPWLLAWEALHHAANHSAG